MKLAITMFALAVMLPAADCSLELRGSSTQHGFVDPVCVLTPHLVAEGYFVHDRGANEGNLGFGWQLNPKPKPTWILTPMLYGVWGKEGGERGIKTGAIIGGQKGNYKLAGFVARYQRLHGVVKNYLVVDQLEATRVVSKHWEAGVSSGIFWQDHAYNQQYGPLAKLNDHIGYTSVSYRFGVRELRVSRVFAKQN